MSTGSKVIARRGRQTDRQTDRHDENIASTAYAGGNEVSMTTASKVIARTDTHTQTHTQTR